MLEHLRGIFKASIIGVHVNSAVLCKHPQYVDMMVRLDLKTVLPSLI